MTPRRFVAKVFRRLSYEIDRSLFEPGTLSKSLIENASPPPPVTPVPAEEPFDFYAVAKRDMELSGWFNHEKHELFPGFALGPDDVVADIGCGFGDQSRFCADQGASLILVDADEARLEHARARWDENDPPIEVHLGRDLPLPIADGRCTHVICNEVLEHVEDPAKFLAELVRIGASGARYLVAVPAPFGEHVIKQIAHPSYFAPPNHIRIIERDEFRKLVTDAGLHVEIESGYGAYWGMWWWFFWCDKQPSRAPRHPVLDHLARMWSALLETENGMLIKRALDKSMPKSQVIIATKP